MIVTNPQRNTMSFDLHEILCTGEIRGPVELLVKIFGAESHPRPDQPVEISTDRVFVPILLIRFTGVEVLKRHFHIPSRNLGAGRKSSSDFLINRKTIPPERCPINIVEELVEPCH